MASLFQAQDVRSKSKSSSDVAATAKKHQVITMELAVQHELLTNEDLMELEMQRKMKRDKRKK